MPIGHGDAVEEPLTATKSTSEVSDVYNCIAWSAGDPHDLVERTTPGNYWPPGIPERVPREVGALIQVFESLGIRDMLKMNSIETKIYEPGRCTSLFRETWTSRCQADGRWAMDLARLASRRHHPSLIAESYWTMPTAMSTAYLQRDASERVTRPSRLARNKRGAHHCAPHDPSSQQPALTPAPPPPGRASAASGPPTPLRPAPR